MGRDPADPPAPTVEEALRESEGRHRFLAELAAATQPLTDADAVMEVTARMLAEHLGVDRCAYAEVEAEAVFVITGDHTRGDVPSIVGRWPVADFGAECERCMRANRAYVMNDVDRDPRAGADLAAYRATTIQSVICVPLHKDGRFAAAMAVHQRTPRVWTPDEIELTRTVVARSWESIERTRVARGLRDAAERLTLTLEAARLGDWSWDAASDLVTFSSRANAIFGIEATTGMTWTAMQALLHPDDREPTRLAVVRAVEERVMYDCEYRVQRPDGSEVWVSAKGRAQYDAAGAALGMFGVVQEITEKKHLEQQLRHRAEELAAADRAKDQFIALLAHELRNPLAPIRAGLEVLRLADDPASAERARAVMDRQLSHLVRLVDDLLDASRVSRGKLHLQRAPVLLAEVVAHAVELVSPIVAEHGHTLSVVLPERELLLDADLTRLAQVFGNLLTNAARYTPRGGRVSIEAAPGEGEVTITVRDSGVGIPRADLARVFEMFSQIDRSFERTTGGLGIGLALVKGLVERHGGRVDADSPGPGQGSSFSVTLPVIARPEAQVEAPGGPSTIRIAPMRRVLIADDNEDGAAMLAELVEVLGNEVHVAHDGLAAVELAERLRPELVLMDIGMPRLNGLDATRRIRAQPWGRTMRIIALTGWGQPADLERSSEAGCDAHLVKPINAEALERALASAG